MQDNHTKDNTYITIIDDTLHRKGGSHVGMVVIGFYICALTVSVIGAISQSLVVAAISLVTIISLYALVCRKAIKKRKSNFENSKTMSEREKIKRSDLIKLMHLLEANGTINASKLNGFIVSPKEMAKLQTIPMYGTISNPPVHAQDFIRTECDITRFTVEDRKLIEKVLGYSEADNVIWFSKKNMAQWAALSRINAISFTNKNKKKMYFGYTRYSTFYNYRVLMIENDECVIHIKDKAFGV